MIPIELYTEDMLVELATLALNYLLGLQLVNSFFTFGVKSIFG